MVLAVQRTRRATLRFFYGKENKIFSLTHNLFAGFNSFMELSPRYKLKFLISTCTNLTSKKSVTRMLNAVSYLEMGHGRKRIACPALALANFRTLSITSSPFYIGYWFPVCFFFMKLTVHKKMLPYSFTAKYFFLSMVHWLRSFLCNSICLASPFHPHPHCKQVLVFLQVLG